MGRQSIGREGVLGSRLERNHEILILCEKFGYSCHSYLPSKPECADIYLILILILILTAFDIWFITLCLLVELNCTHVI